jgi:hypothetical protein
MATLKAQNFELEFSYNDLNGCNEIEYALDIRWGNNPLFNPEIMSDYYKRNGKFVFSDCLDDRDWLHKFFLDIIKTRKGGSIGMTEPPEWHFEAITWEDRRAEKEKSWEGKTCAVGQDDGTIKHEPYAEAMKMFIPLWKNNIELKICIPYEYFVNKETYTDFTLTIKTTFDNLVEFFDVFGKEMNKFYDFFGDRIRYLGDGEYEGKDNFKYKDCWQDMDKDMYLIKRRAEWNNQSANSDDEIVLELLLKDIRWRNRAVGTVRYILHSSITEDLIKKTFTLAEGKLKEEKDEERVKKLEVVKMAIAISFPNTLVNSQVNDALSQAKIEDIPEEIYEKNKRFYPKHLKK